MILSLVLLATLQGPPPEAMVREARASRAPYSAWLASAVPALPLLGSGVGAPPPVFGLTNTRVPFWSSASGRLVDDADLTFTGGNTLVIGTLSMNGATGVTSASSGWGAIAGAGLSLNSTNGMTLTGGTELGLLATTGDAFLRAEAGNTLIYSGQDVGNVLGLIVRDVDGASWTQFLTATAGNTPTVDGTVRNWTVTGTCTGCGATLPVADTTSIVEDNGDPTKEVRVEAGGITAGQVRVWTAPDSNTSIPIIPQIITVTGLTAARTWTVQDAAMTIAGANLNNTFSGSNTFSNATTLNNDQVHTFGTSSNTQLQYDTANAPDTLKIGTATTANSLILAESADTSSDFANGAAGTAAATHPSLILVPATVSTSQYSHLAFWGNAGRVRKDLTAAVATGVVRIPIASGVRTGGTIFYTVSASDGTDYQARAGAVHYQMVNKAGTETCRVSGYDGSDNPAETQDGSEDAPSSGTMTYTWTVSTTPTNACDLELTAASSLTENSLYIEWGIEHRGAGEPLPL